MKESCLSWYGYSDNEDTHVTKRVMSVMLMDIWIKTKSFSSSGPRKEKWIYGRRNDIIEKGVNDGVSYCVSL